MDRRRVVSWALLSLLLASCAPAEGSYAAARAGIVDGEPEPGMPAVVALLGVTGGCTGTLITPRVVLTAKHCIFPERATQPVPASLVSVGVGASFTSVDSHRVQRILTTPGPLEISSGGDPVRGATGTDIALLILQRPIEGVTPIPVWRPDPTELNGTEATAIGYGTRRDGSIGQKYRQTTTISDVTPQLLQAESTICQGDSGGPLLRFEGDQPYVIGVASFGTFPFGSMVGCPAVHDYWNRVDVQMDLIDSAILRSGGCLEPTDESCNSIDDDCDGTIDEGDCLALGEACTSDDECAFGPLPESLREGSAPQVRCAEVEGARVCALPCDPLATGECGAIEHPLGGGSTAVSGFHCSWTGGCDGLCAPGTVGDGTLPNGASCSADTECTSGVCGALGSGRVCLTLCEGGEGACPVGESCSGDVGQCGVCASSAMFGAGRHLGDICDDAAQCRSGMCAVTTSGRICTTTCDNDGACGGGMRCDAGVCERGSRGDLSEPCRDGADCRSLFCTSRDSISYCSEQCVDDGDCRGGTCVARGETRVCEPEGALVGEACTEDAGCAVGRCVDGACAQECGGRASCAPGWVCERTTSGRGAVCVPPVTASGCGCSVPGGGASGGPSSLLALGVALLWLARRGWRARRVSVERRASAR